MAPEVQSLGQIGSAFVYTLPLALAFESPIHLPHLALSVVALLWLGLLGSCAATLLWFSLLHAVGPTRVSMTTYMFPLVGVILGTVFLGEQMDWRLLAGGGLIILAIVLVNLRQGSLATTERTL
jgi:drug/metabolite transporter (DMT)-like permease